MFPAVFYKYMIQQYFTVTTPTLSSRNIKQIKYQMLVFPAIFYKYMIQQYFIVTTSTLSSRNIKQIKYQMLVVVHKET